jgi:hypothetical protein
MCRKLSYAKVSLVERAPKKIKKLLAGYAQWKYHAEN